MAFVGWDDITPLAIARVAMGSRDVMTLISVVPAQALFRPTNAPNGESHKRAMPASPSCGIHDDACRDAMMTEHNSEAKEEDELEWVGRSLHFPKTAWKPGQA